MGPTSTRGSYNARERRNRKSLTPDRRHVAQEEYAMLVLSRRQGEQILIGPDIELTVVGIGGNTVRLGVRAPQKTTVHREKVYRRIQDGGPDEGRCNGRGGAGRR